MPNDVKEFLKELYSADEGVDEFFRQMFKLGELCTSSAVIITL